MLVRAGFERLHELLVGPSLDTDPTLRALKGHIAYARKKHAPVKAHQEALEGYMASLLRGSK
jgi:hypothetical protein